MLSGTMPDQPSCWGHISFISAQEPGIAGIKLLPAVCLQAKAEIVHSCASVTISQTFEIPRLSDEASKAQPVEATYQFPLPENAAIYAFECKLDDRRIAGIVKEKDAARKEYTSAVQEGKTAIVFEQHAPDVFQVSLGNIESTRVVTHITYIQEVGHDADEEEIRFAILSKNIQARFGVPVQAETLSSASAAAVPASISNSDVPAVSISLDMPNHIMSFQSPSHSSMVLSMGATESDSYAFDPCKARIELGAGCYPDKELVVVAKAKGLNEPVCMVERHPIDGTHAFSLTMVPRFALNEIRGELIVLVDRSGSMEGMKIKQAANALEVFLKSIPEGCFFNIIGFGTSHQMLFSKSKEYGPHSLKRAIKHVASLQADLGGTEIESAVQAAFKIRRKDMPTTLFILTDGEVWNVQSLMDTIRTEVEESEYSTTGKDAYPNAFIRVFSLGIGNGVSHHLVEGIADVGRGFAEFVGETEKLKAKVIKMLKAAMLPPIKDCRIHWTNGSKPHESAEEDFEVIGDKDFNKQASTSEVPPSTLSEISESKKLIQQTPFEIRSIFPGVRFNAYALLDASAPVPNEVTITALSPDGSVELSIPVIQAKEGVTIHTMAARKLIKDIEYGQSFLSPMFEGASPKDTAKEEIIRLGTKFCLASKHTSFLAIDTGTDTEILKRATRGSLATLFRYARQDDEDDDDDCDMGFCLDDDMPNLKNQVLETDEDSDDNDIAPSSAEIDFGSLQSHDDYLQALTRIQAFNGSFDLTEVGKLVSIGNVDIFADSFKASGGVVDAKANKILACAIAVVYMRTFLKSLQHEWDMMESKAVKFGKSQDGEHVWEMALEVAKKALAPH
ncbi:hypothetical protein HDU97_001093 [Phlyctochytrium planicorne]|nr:hypothetical protein HDU97_001093 [Phlyctochytrium planicorne]